jgi:hypothetical protein
MLDTPQISLYELIDDKKSSREGFGFRERIRATLSGALHH